MYCLQESTVYVSLAKIRCAYEGFSCCLQHYKRMYIHTYIHTYIHVISKTSIYKLLANYTAWKWRLGKKKNHDLVLDLMAYALMWSFSHACHRSSHESLSPIAVYTVVVLFLQSPLSSCVVSKKLVQVTPACITLTDKTGIYTVHLKQLYPLSHV